MAAVSFCPQCGAPTEPGANFCGRCGRALSGTAASRGEQRPRTSVPPSSLQPQARPTIDGQGYAAFLHLSAFAGVFLPLLGNILGPLVLWLARRRGSTFVDRHGKEALNFQISMTLYALAGFFALVASAVLVVLFIGFVLFRTLALLFLIVLVIVWLVGVIRAIVRASNGREPGYPLVIRFLH